MDIKELQKTVVDLELVASQMQNLSISGEDLHSVFNKLSLLNDEIDLMRQNYASTKNLGLKFIATSVFATLLSFFCVEYVRTQNYFNLLSASQNSLAAYNVLEVKNEEGAKFLKFEKNRLVKNEGDLNYSYIYLGK